MSPVDAATEAKEMPAAPAGMILSAVGNPKKAAMILLKLKKPMDIFNSMEEDKAAKAVKTMTDEEARQFLKHAQGDKVARITKDDPDDRLCGILTNMPDGQAATALKHMEKDRRDSLFQEMGQSDASKLKEVMETSAAMSQGTKQKRMMIFGAVVLFWVAALVLGGLVAVWQKSKMFKVGALVINARGCYFNGKRLFPKVPASANPRSSSSSSLVDNADQEQQLPEGGAEEELPGAGGVVNAMTTVPEPANITDEQALEQQEELLAKNASLLLKRKIVLSLLFAGYVGVSIGIPVLKRHDVSCSNGFFWEDHMPFLGIFALTKTFELLIYVMDPTVQGELGLMSFMLKFLPSFLGYADGYTDAISITIALSCDDDDQISKRLGLCMLIAYAVGVVIAQWLVIACLAHRDSSHACLMKVIHMDALAACVTLPPSAKPIWVAVNVARTTAEDVPQSILQVIFILKVKKNYFMMASVAVSLGSSLKAIYDAMNRTLAAIGTKYDSLASDGPALEEWGSVADRFDMILRHQQTDFCVHLRDGSNGWIYIMKGNLTRKVESQGDLRRDTLSGGQEGKQKLMDNPTQTVVQAGQDYKHGKWTVRPASDKLEIIHQDKGHMYTLTGNAVVAGQPAYESAVSNIMSIMSSSTPTGILRAWGSAATSTDLTLMHKATKFHIHLRNGSNGWLYVMKGDRCAKVEPKSRNSTPSSTSPFGGGSQQKGALEADPDQSVLPTDGSEYKHGTWTLNVVDNTITLTHDREGFMYILTESTVQPAAEHSARSVEGMVAFMTS